jgi:hypothetical protein
MKPMHRGIFTAILLAAGLVGILSAGCTASRDDGAGSYAALTAADDRPPTCEELEDPLPCKKERCAKQLGPKSCLDLGECAWGITAKSKGKHVCGYIGHIEPQPGSGDPGTSHVDDSQAPEPPPDPEPMQMLPDPNTTE